MHEVKKVVIIGPESTGKSTLCEQLALHYNTLWCPEYAREYLLEHGKEYTCDDLLEVAKGQIAKEDEYVEKVAGLNVMNRESAMVSGVNGKEEKPLCENQNLLFIDTDMYVMKVWCEFVFGKCHQFILDQIVERRVDLYLLCSTDLPWVKDELREYPDLETREQLYNIYKDILVNQQVPWVEIHGSNDERVMLAVTSIDNYFFTGA